MGLEGWLCGPVSGDDHGGAVLGGVRMVSAMALAGVPLGSCVVFISEIKSGSGGLWVDSVAGLLVFLTCAVFFLFYLVYGYYSNLPFLSNLVFIKGKNNDKERRKKSSGPGTNFHLAVFEKVCVQNLSI